MRTAALFLLAGCLAAVPAAAEAADGALFWERVIELYRPGGALNPRLGADIELLAPGPEGRPLLEPAHFLYKPLNDLALTPMGYAEGARWLRERLKEVRGPAPSRRGGLVGWVLERNSDLAWKSVPVGAIGR